MGNATTQHRCIRDRKCSCDCLRYRCPQVVHQWVCTRPEPFHYAPEDSRFAARAAEPRLVVAQVDPAGKDAVEGEEQLVGRAGVREGRVAAVACARARAPPHVGGRDGRGAAGGLRLWHLRRQRPCGP